MTDTTILNRRQLRIPYVSQNGEGAQYGLGDCGIACVTALVRAFVRPDLTVDHVGAAAGLLRGYRAASIDSVRRAALLFGIRLVPRSRLTPSQIGQELDVGHSVIALVWYPLLPTRRLPNYRGGHFITITGYEVTEAGTVFRYDDPEWLERADGEACASAPPP